MVTALERADMKESISSNVLYIAKLALTVP
jgi:hypothetical protein